MRNLKRVDNGINEVACALTMPSFIGGFIWKKIRGSQHHLPFIFFPLQVAMLHSNRLLLNALVHHLGISTHWLPQGLHIANLY